MSAEVNQDRCWPGDTLTVALHTTTGILLLELRVTKEGKPEIFIDDEQQHGLLVTTFEHWTPLK
jgi:hypothetical protein